MGQLSEVGRHGGAEVGPERLFELLHGIGRRVRTILEANGL